MYYAENVYLNKWSDSPSEMEQIILDEILFNPDQWKCTCKNLRDNLKYFLTRLGVCVPIEFRSLFLGKVTTESPLL